MRVRNYIACLVVLSFIYFGAVVVVEAMPEAKITLKVVDENNDPVSGVDVALGFAGIKDKTFKTLTDASGTLSASYETSGPISYSAEKEGYYYSHGQYIFTKIDNNQWVPWNQEVNLILRKIDNPVPMYARKTKDTKLEIPIAGKEVGFDLIKYDWVAPYGKGQHADFIFRLDKKHVNEDDFESTLTLTFPNKFDGIHAVREDRRYGSIFKLPRIAPLVGYQNKLSRTIKRLPGKGIEKDFRDENNYIFRIRSEEKDSKFERAMYGKIQGDIEVYPGNSKTARIVFKYYLNPDYTQNLEYDPSQNLFLDLRDRRRLDWVGMK